MMNLPHRITFQALTTTSAGGGTYSETWTNYRTVWANCKADGKEVDDSKVQQYNYYKIAVRKADYTNAMRVIFKGKIIHIESIIDENYRNNMMILKGREEIGS